ncbi:MAG: hypothetical protein ACYTG6_06055 [Planctomycetota bacterium]|jgi:hypothetical protein
MKFLPVLLLNVVTVAVAILAYDHLRSDVGRPGEEADDVALDPVAIERRLAALEAEQQPVLQGEGSEAVILRRLDALERRLQLLGEAVGAPGLSAGATDPGSSHPEDPLFEGVEDLAPEEVERFRRLQEAARRQDRIQRNQVRVNQAIDGTGVPLTPDQRGQLLEAYVEFEPRRIQIWGEAKARGQEVAGEAGWDSIIRETNLLIQREFTDRISGFLHQADAERIAEALHPIKE